MTAEAEPQELSPAQKAKKTREAGKRFEKKIRDYLATLGFRVQPAHQSSVFVPNRGRISVQADFFGCLDMIAIHRSFPYVLGIQATLAEGIVRSKQKKIDGVEDFNIGGPWRLQVWTKDASTANRMIVWEKVPNGEWHEMSFRMTDHVWPLTIFGQEPPKPAKPDRLEDHGQLTLPATPAPESRP